MTGDPPAAPAQRTDAASPLADLVAHLARFAGELRRSGVAVALTDEIDAAHSLALVDIGDHQEVRLALRCSMKVPRRHWPAFDRLFFEMWRTGTGAPPRSARRDQAREAPKPPPARSGRGSSLDDLRRRLVQADAAEPRRDDGNADPGHPGWSPRAALRRKSFEQCTEDNLAEMKPLFERLVRRIATRRSRRKVPSPRGRLVDVRRSFRHSLARGGELVVLARRNRAVEKPHIVVLCDTSGSMDPYTRFFLAFVLTLKRVVPEMEVFAFNTRLTRLTPWIAARDPSTTLASLARNVGDWSGGTRIGECLAAFATQYLRSAVSGDTSVLIFSDGLDRGDTAQLEEALGAVRRRARRVVWLNPLMGYHGYRPEARGMKAALPHLDALVPAHDMASLEALLAIVERR